MNIFSEIKEYVTARDVAEFYGLKVRRNGLACCPFHDDKHPSMKIDKIYYCFACGAKGDAIHYVANQYGMSQYEAAKKIAEDFHIVLETDYKKDVKNKKQLLEQRKVVKTEEQCIGEIKKKFKTWCNKTSEQLKDCLQIIADVKKTYLYKLPDEIFESEGFVFLLHKEPIISY